MILDDFDDHGLIEEPVPKHASVFVDRWVSYINKMLENTEGQLKMENPEKLATQDEE